MPKKIKEMAISVPIKLELSTDEQQILTVEIVNKKQILNNLSEKTKQEADLLSLINSILKIYETTPQSFDKTRFLKAVILEYKKNSEKIDWKKYLTIPPLPSSPPAITACFEQSPKLAEIKAKKQQLNSISKETNQGDSQTAQASLEISMVAPLQFQSPSLIEIQKAKLRLKPIKPMNEDTVQESKRIAQSNDCIEFKLKPVKQDIILPSCSIEMTVELAKKLAEQNARIENTVNTNNNDIDLSKEATQLLENLQPYLTEEEFDNLEYDLNEKNSESQLNELTFQEIRNEYCYKIVEPLLKDLKRYLSPERFNELEDEISVKYLEKQLGEELLQKIIDVYDRSLRALSVIIEGNENLGFFKHKPVSDNTPRIVEAILKPTAKI